MNCSCTWDSEKHKVVSECGAHVEHSRELNAYTRSKILEERDRLLSEAGKKAVDFISVQPKDMAEAVQTGIIIGEVRALERVYKMLS
jgi:hypothetical protein